MHIIPPPSLINLYYACRSAALNHSINTIPILAYTTFCWGLNSPNKNLPLYFYVHKVKKSLQKVK